MFSHILVPVALNDSEDSAISIAINLAKNSKARVTLLHVVELIAGVPFEELADFYESLNEKCRVKIEKIAERALAEGVSCTAEVVLGNRVQDIVTQAEEKKVDLIVMQSHKVDSSDGPKSLNTISYQVGLLSRSAVLLVK